MVGAGLGVSYIEIAILALLTLNLLLTLWQTRILGLSISKLDGNIAQALPLVLEEAVSNLDLTNLPEPANPIMSIIAEAIGNSIKPPSLEVKEVVRSSDGKFS